MAQITEMANEWPLDDDYLLSAEHHSFIHSIPNKITNALILIMLFLLCFALLCSVGKTRSIILPTM